MDTKAWFREAKFGLMLHFGLYSILGGEWKGRRTDIIGEWAQSYFEIPQKEYEKLAKIFNPIYFDAEEWARLAAEAGMKYIVVTSKHHDGFALFKSETDSYNVVDATPFGRDIIAEFAAACKKYNLRLGLYYSQDLDWHEPHGGGYKSASDNCGFMSWTNNWDYPDKTKKDFNIYYEKKSKPQIKEILTKYGDLCLIWFDTPLTLSPEQSDELYELVKKYQPGCLVNSRIGNGRGDYISLGDNETDINFSAGDKLYESPTTLNDTWGYKSFDNNWKSAEHVLAIKEKLNSRGVNYLVNIGPDALGRMPAPAQEILREVGKAGGVK